MLLAYGFLHRWVALFSEDLHGIELRAARESRGSAPLLTRLQSPPECGSWDLNGASLSNPLSNPAAVAVKSSALSLRSLGSLSPSVGLVPGLRKDLSLRTASAELRQALGDFARELPQSATKNEKALYKQWTRCTVEYLEWGIGGSTSTIYRNSWFLRQISFVESSKVWVKRVTGLVEKVKKAVAGASAVGRGSASSASSPVAGSALGSPPGANGPILSPFFVDWGAGSGYGGGPAGSPTKEWERYPGVLNLKEKPFRSFLARTAGRSDVGGKAVSRELQTGANQVAQPRDYDPARPFQPTREQLFRGGRGRSGTMQQLFWPDTVYIDGRFRTACFFEVLTYFLENKGRFLRLNNLRVDGTAKKSKRPALPGVADSTGAIAVSSQVQGQDSSVSPVNKFYHGFRSNFHFPTILWHDFNRGDYHDCLQFARIVAKADSLVVLEVDPDLRRPSKQRWEAIQAMRNKHKYNWF